MKKIATILLIAASMFAATAKAQNDPMAVYLASKGQDTINSLLTQFAAQNTYLPLVLAARNKQTISAHYDTVTGKYFTVVTASRLDSIKLKTSLYSSGAILRFLCTTSSNDSTLILPSSGNINGASTLWWTGTYKTLNLYYDGTNYWKL